MCGQAVLEGQLRDATSRRGSKVHRSVCIAFVVPVLTSGLQSYDNTGDNEESLLLQIEQLSKVSRSFGPAMSSLAEKRATRA